MSTPEQPPAAAPQVQQLSTGLVDTPAGQRLAVTLTILLDPADAKAYAAAISTVAAAMSASGLIVTGTMNGVG